MRLNFLTPPPIPEHLPIGLKQEIEKLSKYPSKEQVLREAYDLLTNKYRGYRLKTITNFFELFDDSVDSMWSKAGFLHCTNMNYLMEILLIGSGKFNRNDLRFRWTAIHFYSPHEYLKIRVTPDKWIDVDLWGRAYGISFGEHAHGLHSGSLKKLNL